MVKNFNIASQSVTAGIRRQALETPNVEICGVIVKLSCGVLHPFQCKNVAGDTTRFFKINYIDIAKAGDNGEIMGYYHSHPHTTRISVYDKIVAQTNGFPLVTYFVQNDTFDVYNPNLYKSYIGRVFAYGYADCFQLVRDFYSAEYGINIKNYSYDETWKHDAPDKIDANYSTEGFAKVCAGPPDKTFQFVEGDVIVIGPYGGAHGTHLVIYIGDNCVLAQPNNMPSCLYEYSDLHRRLTKYVLRHCSFIP